MQTINHDLRVVDGQTLYKPPWAGGQEGWDSLALPDVYAPDTVQKYPLGTKFVDGMRTYYYAKSGGITNTDMGVKNGLTQHVAYATIAASAALYATTVVIDVGAADGAAGDGVIAANELAGGYLIVFPHSSNTFVRRIATNTAVGSGGGECTLTLNRGIPAAIVVDADHGEIMANPFLNVKTATDSTSSVLGMASCLAASGTFVWIQTWGPCWLAPQGEVSVGNNNRQVVFRHDGSFDEHDYSDANVAKGQHGGFVLANAAGGGQGAPFVMLQIIP